LAGDAHQEGIAAADRGDFVPDEEVEAFFAKWADAES
jgi:predicted transcriptional regulator